MIITYNEERQRFEVQSSYAERNEVNPLVKGAGFSFDFDGARVWHSQAYSDKPQRTWLQQVAVAGKLFTYLDFNAKAKIANDADANLIVINLLAKEVEKKESLNESRATDAEINIPRPEGLDYLPFQKAGIRYALRIFGDV